MSGFEALLAAQIGGTVLKTIGGVVSAEEDSKIARANAIQTQAEYSELARIEAADGRRMTEKARVRAAASGLSLDGSALDIIGELEAEGNYRARGAIHQGRVRYDNFRAEQKNAKKRKTVAIASGIAEIGSTMLTSGLKLPPAADPGAGAAVGARKAVHTSTQMAGL